MHAKTLSLDVVDTLSFDVSPIAGVMFRPLPGRCFFLTELRRGDNVHRRVKIDSSLSLAFVRRLLLRLERLLCAWAVFSAVVRNFIAHVVHFVSAILFFLKKG